MARKARKKVLKQKHLYTNTGVMMVQNDTVVFCSYNHQQIKWVIKARESVVGSTSEPKLPTRQQFTVHTKSITECSYV